MKSRYRWIILVQSYMCMLGFAFSLQSIPPIVPIFIDELGFTRSQAGLLMGLFALSGIFLSVLTGFFSDRIGARRVGLAMLSLLVIGDFVLFTGGSFARMAAGRIIAGIGASASVIIAPQVISQWFRGHESGTAMGIFNTAMPIGTIVCFTFFGRLAEESGWRFPLLLPVLISGAALAAFAAMYRDAPETKKAAGGLFSSIAASGALVLLLGLCWMLFNAAVISFSTFGADFFVSKGMSIKSAGIHVSLLMWGSLILSPLIGRLLDRIGRQEVLIGTGGLIMAFLLAALSKTGAFLIIMIIFSISVSFVPSSVFSLPARIARPETLGMAFGVLLMSSSAGMFIGPFTAGLIRDSSGSYGPMLVYLSLIAVLLAGTALLLRAVLKNAALPHS